MKKQKRSIRSWVFSIFALGIASMLPFAKGSMSAQQKPLFIVSSPFELEKKRVDVDVSVLDAEASKRILGIDYPQRGIQPVYLTIHNHTSNPYLIRPDQIDLPLMDVKKMVDKEGRTGRIGRSIFFRIVGFFFWPASIPGTIDSVLSSKAQSSFAHEVHAKALKEEALAPFSVVHRIFFVSDKALKDFTITLANQEMTETLRCEVSLQNV